MSCEAKRLSVVVPCYNEQGNIGPLVDEIQATLGDRRPVPEIIVVDDGPRADSGAELHAARERLPFTA